MNPPANRTASDLLLQVLQGGAMDMNAENTRASNDFFNGQVTDPASHTGMQGVTDGGLASRSIWSSGIGGLPPGLQSGTLSRPSSASRHSSQAASAEALFNSMPNQNQSVLPPPMVADPWRHRS